MDSISQAVLGASVAGVCAPRGQRRKALLAGAVLGTLPDLDVFIDYGGAVENFTFHRAFSHSLFVLAPFAVLLWLLLRRFSATVREAPYPWLAAIGLALLTHPLLDAHTAYGTQLFWPLEVAPTFWATLFIIDPLYTLPLLIGTLLAAVRPASRLTDGALRTGLLLSTAYVGWSWAAQGMVMQHVDDALAGMPVENGPVFLTPTPFNTLLWRIVVQTEDGYLEGFDSLAVDDDLSFTAYDSDQAALEAATDLWAVARLRWFAQDFLRARVIDDRLVLSDLRMGLEPNYVFTHAVAVRGNPHWQAIPAELLPFAIEDRSLTMVWNRIWSGEAF